MPNKVWSEMGQGEKIEWLHDTLRKLIDMGNQNADRLDAREARINHRLLTLEAAIESVVAEAR